MSNRTMRATLAALILAWACGLSAQQAPAPAASGAGDAAAIAALERKAAEARQQEDWPVLLETTSSLHSQRPNVPGYMLEIIRAAAALGERQTAYQYMLKLQQSGLSYDMNQIPQTADMRGAEAYQHINNLMLEAGKPMGVAENVLSVPGSPADIGDLAWDASRQRFLLGTRRDGRVLAVADDGSGEVLLEADAENGLWSIDGLAVDAANGSLWVASSAYPVFAQYSPADAHRGALFRFDLETLELRERFNLDVDGLPHRLGHVAVTAAGDVYVLDRAMPFIFRKAADGDKLEVFAAMPKLSSLTDLAVTPDNSRLFVADAVMGILVIDPVAGHSALLSGPQNLNLFGVYGLEYANGNLVVTQGGLSPQRIMRLTLDASGAAVEGVIPMAVAMDGFDTPGTGVIRDESLYFFANHGAARDANKRLMVSPLDSGQELKPPDMRLFERMMQERMQQLEEQQGQQEQSPQ